MLFLILQIKAQPLLLLLLTILLVAEISNIDKLLNNLEGVGRKDRTARFVCAACCAFPDGKVITVRGECEGEILTERHGSGGFGYDPVFMSGGKSFGEITAEEKDAMSHRGKALRLMSEELKKIITE